jgi:hypothetical protein
MRNWRFGLGGCQAEFLAKINEKNSSCVMSVVAHPHQISLKSFRGLQLRNFYCNFRGSAAVHASIFSRQRSSVWMRDSHFPSRSAGVACRFYSVMSSICVYFVGAVIAMLQVIRQILLRANVYI